MNAIVHTSEGHPPPLHKNDILGSHKPVLRASGKIRAGIKVLTRAAAAKPGVQNIFDKGTEAGASNEAIVQRIRTHLGDSKAHPLTPRNVPYFTVKAREFSDPEVAKLIMDEYGTDTEDGRVLKSFPIYFSTDDIYSALPHALKCFGAKGLQYWSEYDSVGNRFCKMYEPLQPNTSNNRGARQFGGRNIILRNENNGECIPGSCREYQSRACTLSGSLFFHIPKVPRGLLIELSTRSFYALSEIRQQLAQVSFKRGRISGFEQGKPIFYVTKVQRMVSMLDPQTKQPIKVKQWLTEVQVDQELLFLSESFNDEDTLSEKATEAYEALENTSTAPSEAIENNGLDNSFEMPEFPSPEGDNNG